MSDIYENVELDEDYLPLLMSMGYYRLFMSKGKAGRDAMAVFLHLMFTARLQHTNSVKANLKYIAAGLSMGERTVKQAKALLKELEIIEYVQRRREDGTLGEQYIKIRFMPTREATEKAEEATGGSLTAPPVNRTTGSDCQMLKVNNENSLNEEGNASPIPTESEESSEEKASESASPTPSDPITASDLEEWCEDYSDLPLQHDSASLANLNRLEHDRRDIRAAIVAWLPSVRGKAPNLAWFLKQGGPQLAEAKLERLKYEEMTRSAARVHEERMRWQEEQDELTEEEREENLHLFDDLRAKLNAKVPA